MLGAAYREWIQQYVCRVYSEYDRQKQYVEFIFLSPICLF